MKIFIATHKKYNFPTLSEYIPIQSGSALNPSLGYLRDDEGDNISKLNLSHNILCVIYWAWKNIDDKVVGVVHYRRLFGSKISKSIKDVLKKEDIDKILENSDIIVAKRRCYFPFSIRNHYIYTKAGYHEIHSNDLKFLEETICKLTPEYKDAFDSVMKSYCYLTGSLFIMKKSSFDAFCEFMFTVCDDFYEKLKVSRSDQTRYVASVSELLLEVWIIKNNIKYFEAPLVEPEKLSFYRRLFNLTIRTITGYYKGT